MATPLLHPVVYIFLKFFISLENFVKSVTLIVGIIFELLISQTGILVF